MSAEKENENYMENRISKEELIELINTLKIDKNEFWILSTGALVLRGILKDAGDLDIAVTNIGLEQLKQNYNLKEKGNGWLIVKDKVECICDGEKSKLKYQPEKCGEYYVQNINEYFEYLNSSDREKDKLKIPLVDEYIKSNGRENGDL